MPLCLPKSVTVVLKTPEGNPLRLADVLIGIQTFARHKNDISLFPFATNPEGIAYITNEEMRAEISATYDSGLMDFVSIEFAYELIEIRLSSQKEIKQAIDSRTNTWTQLLDGEGKRWGTINDLISLLKSSTSHLLDIPEELSIRPKIRDTWTRPDAEYNYEIRVRRKA